MFNSDSFLPTKTVKARGVPTPRCPLSHRTTQKQKGPDDCFMRGAAGEPPGCREQSESLQLCPEGEPSGSHAAHRPLGAMRNCPTTASRAGAEWQVIWKRPFTSLPCCPALGGIPPGFTGILPRLRSAALKPCLRGLRGLRGDVQRLRGAMVEPALYVPVQLGEACHFEGEKG